MLLAISKTDRTPLILRRNIKAYCLIKEMPAGRILTSLVKVHRIKMSVNVQITQVRYVNSPMFRRGEQNANRLYNGLEASLSFFLLIIFPS